MKHTTLAYLGLLVVVFIAQHVSAQDELPKATEVDPPIDAAEENSIEKLPVVYQESNIAESIVGGSSSSHGSGSIYGNYNSKQCCWNGAPRVPRLGVNDRSQSEHVRRKTEYMLSKNTAVEQTISKNAMNCEKSHWGSVGLLDNCPSSYCRATEVRYWGKKCYIVRPHQQCVTFRQCYPRRSCAYGVGPTPKRSSLHDVPSLKSLKERIHVMESLWTPAHVFQTATELFMSGSTAISVVSG